MVIKSGRRCAVTARHALVAANVRDQDLRCKRVHQRWSADIGDIWTSERLLYLSIGVDLCSGWEARDRRDRMKKAFAISAL